MSLRSRALPWLTLSMLALGAADWATAADDPCAGFKWNVTEERAVFSQKAQSSAAGHDAASAPALKTKTLYDLSLSPEEGVKFVVPPGKKPLPDGAFAGLVHFRVSTTGAYRVALDQGLWIDVVSHQASIEATGFTGAHDCTAPRKIVQYNLPAGEDLMLQISGAKKNHVRVAVTPAPAASAAPVTSTAPAASRAPAASTTPVASAASVASPARSGPAATH